jgi:hypothetical protein
VSWAVYSQANKQNPSAVRAAKLAFRATERSLSSMRSPKLAAPMPNAQVAAYRHGRLHGQSRPPIDQDLRQIALAAVTIVLGARFVKRRHAQLTGTLPAQAHRSRWRGS